MRKMKLPGGTHSSASTDPRLHRRTSRKPGFAGAGINLRKLGTPASKSGAVATPLLKWKFHDRVCVPVPVAGGGEPAAGRRGSRRVRGVDEGSVSVRKLGAGLWQLRQVAQVGGGGVRGRGVQCGRSDHLGFKLESTLSYPKSAMEGATKWDPGCQKTSDEVNNFYDRMRIFEDQHSTTASVVSVLQAELVKARARIHELEAEQRSSKNKFEHFLRKLSKERTSWQRREHQKIRMFVDDLKDGLNRERKNCQRMEIINAKLVNELGDAKLSAKQFLQNYEKERKARELLEEVCNELAKEIAEDKAEVEALKRESMKIHEEVEEERKMLQMAEVWREERVQMKLVDAKLTLEHKYSQMNKIIEDIQVFLESRSVASDAMELRKAELIQQAASSVNIQDSDFSYVVPQTYDIFSIIKELQNSEANEREIEPYADYNTTHHAAKIHNVSPDVNGLKGSPLLKHSMGFIVHDGGLEEDASGWDTASHAEDGASVYSVEGIDPSVNGKNFSGGGTEWDENARQDSLTTEVSEVCSVSAKESSQKASLVSKIWRSGLGNGEIYKIISVEANGRLSNGTISNVETISPTERDFGKGGISPHNSLMQCGSPGLGNSHINQGLKGSIEWKQGVQKNSLKAKLLEARMGSGKIQLRHVLKQKS